MIYKFIFKLAALAIISHPSMAFSDDNIFEKHIFKTCSFGGEGIEGKHFKSFFDKNLKQCSRTCDKKADKCIGYEYNYGEQINLCRIIFKSPQKFIFSSSSVCFLKESEQDEANSFDDNEAGQNDDNIFKEHIFKTCSFDGKGKGKGKEGKHFKTFRSKNIKQCSRTCDKKADKCLGYEYQYGEQINICKIIYKEPYDLVFNANAACFLKDSQQDEATASDDNEAGQNDNGICENLEANDNSTDSCKEGADDVLPENLQELMTRLEAINEDYLKGIDLESPNDNDQKVFVILSSGQISVEKHREDSSGYSYGFLTENYKIEDVTKSERSNYDEYRFDVNGWAVKIGTSKFDGSDAEKELYFVIIRKSFLEEFMFTPFIATQEPVTPSEELPDDALSRLKKELSDNFDMVNDIVTLREKTGRGKIELIFEGTKLSVKKVSGEDFVFFAEDVDTGSLAEIHSGGYTFYRLSGFGEGYRLVHFKGSSRIQFTKGLESFVFEALLD